MVHYCLVPCRLMSLGTNEGVMDVQLSRVEYILSSQTQPAQCNQTLPPSPSKPPTPLSPIIQPMLSFHKALVSFTHRLYTGVHNQCITNVCVIFNCIQVLILNVPQTRLFILVLKLFYYRNEQSLSTKLKILLYVLDSCSLCVIPASVFNMFNLI